MSARPARASALAAFALCACPPETVPGVRTLQRLVDADAWVELEAADDPFADHRPADLDCGVAGWHVEGEVLEIDTNFCPHLTLRQPARVAVAPGFAIELELGHFDLVAPEPGLAHMALQIGATVVWEREVAIPAQGTVYSPRLTIAPGAPAGAPVYLHVHNHGQNTYQLYRVDAGAGERPRGALGRS